MAFPVIPVLSGIAGLGAGAGIMGALGSGKKEEHNIYHQPYEYYAPSPLEYELEVFAPQIQYSPQISYQYEGATYIINSPEATSKKEQSMKQTSTPRQKGTWEFPADITQEPHHEPQMGEVDTGTSLSSTLLPIVVIAVIGLLGYGFITRKRK